MINKRDDIVKLVFRFTMRSFIVCIFLINETIFGCFFANLYLEILVVKVRNVAKIWNRYNQVPHLTVDTTWESDKNTIKQEPRGQSIPSR